MFRIKHIVVAAATFAIASPAFAGPNDTPGIDKREAVQQQRIEQGVKSGALTGNEAARLEQGQARVEKMEARAKSDGRVTRQERQRIHKAQDHQSKHIHRAKHNRRHR